MISLPEILKAATGITCHSKQVAPGNVFVAINGRSQDGNLYTYEAACKGASAIISDSHDSQSILGVPVISVPDARAACAWIAAEYYHHPSREMSLTGVTGTNGKTTIVAMLRQMYQMAGFQSGLIGTVHVQIGNYSLPSKLTTPDAISLQQFLRQMREQNVSHAAMEVSAQGMELKRVDHVSFACGILSNICPDHLDFHGDYSSYINAKQLFPSFLSGSPLVVNAADPLCLAIARSYGGPVITVGINTPADISACLIRSDRYGSVFELDIDRKLTYLVDRQQAPFQCHLSAPGLHNVENALLALAAALTQGVSLLAVQRALASYGGVQRRFNVCSHDGRTVIDDTALNPGSIDAVFHTIGHFRYKRLVVVNAIRGCRGAAINTANAQALTRWQSELPFTMIITSSCDQTSSSDRVTQQEKSSFLSELDRSRAKYLYTETLSEAILSAQAITQPGDLLLLIGAQGMDHGLEILNSVSQPFSLGIPAALPH